MLGHMIAMLVKLRKTPGTEVYFAINARMLEKANKGVEVINIED